MSDEDHGRANALAWLKNIVEMVEDFRAKYSEDPCSDASDEARERMEQSVLSVEMRSGWYVPGARQSGPQETDGEYRILLTTGGPAAQITGDLNEYLEVQTATLQYQDWFKPWTDLPVNDEERDALLTFARCFYFGS